VPTFTRLSEQANRQRTWQGWLEERLSPELRPRLSGVVERNDTLVVFAESAAWSARLRYALAELEDELRARNPEITRISVRVMPRT
jgi:Protein of unknown function (DUF721).